MQATTFCIFALALDLTVSILQALLLCRFHSVSLSQLPVSRIPLQLNQMRPIQWRLNLDLRLLTLEMTDKATGARHQRVADLLLPLFYLHSRGKGDGCLDTPAKYREMMAASNEDEIEEMVADLPPPKRRRTLAGSIVSTALSAALIGTAVGLTVYRLWRDRGKQPESLPPPPYEQGEWVPPKPDPSLPTSIPVTQVTPPTPRSRRTRHVAGRRGHTRHRKTYSRAAQASTSSLTSTPSTRAPIPPEFNFGVPPAEPEVEMDDQMSWIGDKLASLIAEGQRALGKEVVVMSEAREDEEDDGAEDWIEENQVRSRASSRRPSKLPRTSGLPSYSVSRHGSPLPSASPRRDTFDLSQSYNSSYAMSIPGSPRRRGREASVESDAFGSTSFREDESSWQTPELREAMERARMRYLQDRA